MGWGAWGAWQHCSAVVVVMAIIKTMMISMTIVLRNCQYMLSQSNRKKDLLLDEEDQAYCYVLELVEN
jgi:hypothetical protein